MLRLDILLCKHLPPCLDNLEIRLENICMNNQLIFLDTIFMLKRLLQIAFLDNLTDAFGLNES